MLIFSPIDWTNISISISENNYISTEIVNNYDITSGLIFYYLVSRFETLLNSNIEKIDKINITQMIIEIIYYIYSLYNIDSIKNILEVKRFEYLLDGSELNYSRDAQIMVDLLKKGQGLEAKAMDETLGESVDIMEEYMIGEGAEPQSELREEAEALDVESYDWEESGEYEEGNEE